MSDLIDREAVMEIILMPQNVSITEQLEMLKKLPSAEPKKRMTQEQINNIRERMCDNYCKWQGMPVQRVLYDICNKCPMNELEPKTNEQINRKG